MKRTITIRSTGINWDHFDEFEIDFEKRTAKPIKGWRRHKWNDSDVPVPECTEAKIYRNQSDISRWKRDGMPGGVEGLQANYKKPDRIVCFEKTFMIEKGE